MSQLLLSELTSLSSETRRKHPEVRAAADAALATLKADQAQALRQANSWTGPAEENLLLKPILLACVGKTASKVASIAVGLMQRVVGIKVVPETALPTLIETLSNLVQSRNDVDVHLKVLQVVSSLLSSYTSIHGDLLADALHVCFRLQDSRVTVVSSTAAATLRQAVMTVFDKVKDEDAVLDALKTGGEDAAAAAPLAAMTVPIPGTDGVTLFPCSRDAFKTITDLNSLASGEQAPFLRLSSLPRTFSLELIESVLTNHSHLFRPSTHPELLLCLRQATCPLLIRGLSERPAFPITLRLMRLLFVLLRQFSQELRVEVEILMSILLRLLAPPSASAAAHQGEAEDQHHPTPIWQRVLAMEATRSLCSDGELLRNLWKWYDGSASSAAVFTGLVDALQRLAVEQPGAIGKADPADQLTSDDAIAAPRPSISGSRGLYEAAASAVGALAGSSSSADAGAGAGLSQTSVPGIQLLDQLDKADAPTPPTTYLYLLALQSLVHLSQSMASFVLPAYSTFVNSRPKAAPRAPPALDLETYSGDHKAELVVLRSMIKQSWTAIQTSYTFFLSSKCDEALFSEVLVALRNFTNAAGVLGLQGPRDALIAALSRFAVPRTVLNRLEEQRKSGIGGAGATQEELAHAVALSERNAACLKAVTQIAYYLSGSLAWREVLETLCDAEYVLRCTGSKRRRAAASEVNEDTAGAAYSPRASMASFSQLSANVAGFSSATSIDPRTGRPGAMGGLETETLLADIARVFENTQALDAKAFLGFLQALCSLCADGTGATRPGTGAPSTPTAKRASVAPTRPRASLAERSFALVSLELVIMLNVARLTLLGPEHGWTVITAQLVAIISDASVKPAFRSQAAGILDAFLFAAISAKAPAGVGSDAEANVASPERIQRQVLDALSQQAVLQERRASVADVDVRRQALDALLRILEAHGHGLVLGCETIFEMCSAACAQVPAPPEAEAAAPTAGPRSPVPLIKAAFASLQLVCSDLLSALSLKQLELCVASLTAFSKQDDDVNVALTANGTLWGITAELAARAAADPNVNEELTALWTYLLRSLLRVSADQRSDVRNGAISNLFRVLEQYGAGLDAGVWAEVIMADVVFPLLAELEAASKAEKQKAKGDSGLESRDKLANNMGTRASPQAQWDESRVLATTSFGQVVAQYLGDKLVASGDERFQRIWDELLRRLQSAFLEGPSSISQASILALQAIVSGQVPDGEEQVYKAAWGKAWQTWSTIGAAIPTAAATLTQANLLAFVNTLTPIYRLLVSEMPLAQLEQLLASLKNCVAYAASPDEIPDVDSLTPVQAAVRIFITSMQIIPGLPTLLIADLAEYSTLALTAAAAPALASTANGKKASSFTYVALNKAVVQDILSHFERFEAQREIFESGALESTFASLLVPIKLKYECPAAFRHAPATKQSLPLWQSATLVFCKLARGTCKALEREGDQLKDEHVAGLWRQMLLVFQAALDADCSPALKLDAADAERDEIFDLTLLATLELDVLSHLGGARVPADLITSLASALSRASRLYEVNLDGGEGSHELKDGKVAPISPRPRECFAYWAFDLLFLICSDRWQDNLDSRRRVVKLALPALLERCSQAMKSYVADARLRGMSPSPRLREEELCYILSSLIDLHLWPGSLSSDRSRPASESASTDTSLRSLALCTPRAHLFALYPILCSLLAFRAPSGAPTSKGTSPGTSRLLGVPLLLPSDFQLGRVGKSNPLESARLDREGSVHAATLVEQALETVGSFWA